MRPDPRCQWVRCLRRPPAQRVTRDVILTTRQIARVLGVSDESSARRAIARWRARGVVAVPVPSAGGRPSLGVAVADVAWGAGLCVDDVVALAGVEMAA